MQFCSQTLMHLLKWCVKPPLNFPLIWIVQHDVTTYLKAKKLVKLVFLLQLQKLHLKDHLINDLSCVYNSQHEKLIILNPCFVKGCNFSDSLYVCCHWLIQLYWIGPIYSIYIVISCRAALDFLMMIFNLILSQNVSRKYGKGFVSVLLIMCIKMQYHNSIKTFYNSIFLLLIIFVSGRKWICFHSPQIKHVPYPWLSVCNIRAAESLFMNINEV